MKNQWNCQWQLPKAMLCFCLSMFLFSAASYAQENCTNGQDDDGDGLIDCYDPDCCNDGACTDFYYRACVPDCQAPLAPFTFSIQQVWQTAPLYSGNDMPIIGDIDPNSPGSEIVVTQYFNSLVTVLNGTTGAVLAISNNSVAVPFNPGNFSAIGNLDADPAIEIIVSNFGTHMISCFEYSPGTLTLQWTRVLNTPNRTVVPAIADFEGDGLPEVYVGREIFDGATGNPLITSVTGVGEGRMDANNGSLGDLITTVAADVDATRPGLELVAGRTLYDVDLVSGTLTHISNNNFMDGRTAVADYDNDGDLDGFITAVDATSTFAFLYVWDLLTGATLATYLPFIGAHMSLAAIGDVTGDGQVDIVINENGHLTVLTRPVSGIALNVFHREAIAEPTYASPTLFDFDGNGVKEIIFREGHGGNLSVWGLSGTPANLGIIGTIPFNGPTGMEVSAIVADIDHDNQAEIISICGGIDNSRVMVFESAATPWRPTRTMWNQYAYFGTNINDDLSIPTPEQQRNVFANGDNRINYFLSQYSDGFNPIPDAEVTVLSVNCLGEDMQIELSICNLGDAPLPATTPLSIYDANPTMSSAILILPTSTIGQVVPAGNCMIVTVTIPNFVSGTNYFAAINAPGNILPPFVFPVTNILECDYRNNITDFSLLKPVVEIDITSLDTPFCTGDTVELMATVTGNTQPYDYNWNTGASTNIITEVVTTTTTYSVVVTDVNNCSDESSVTLDAKDCCFAFNNPDYLQISPSNNAFLTAQGFGSFTGNTFNITPNQYHTWPDKVYVDEDVIVHIHATTGVTTLDLTNVDIAFGQCARISTSPSPNTKIIAYNAVFRPCNPEKSWYGIYFRGGSNQSHTFQECTFVNANRAIHVEANNINISINNNLFTNCQRGVQFSVTATNNELANISGNTFEIDDKVFDIAYTRGLAPNCQLVGIFAFFGIHGGYNFTRPIAQNDFVNNTDVNNHAAFFGIFTTGINMNISSNNFTNMHRSIDIASNTPNSGAIVVENNRIEVTNNVTGDHFQIRITDQTSALIENNTIVSSAEELMATLNEAAIYVKSSNTVAIRNNTLQGFQIGLFNDASRCYVANNKIYSHEYGIYQYNFATSAAGPSSYYSCNEIEMDVQYGYPSQGIYVINDGATGDPKESGNCVITSNCILNTSTAISLNDWAQANYLDIPIVHNNYLYNYYELGLGIGGSFAGNIGNFFTTGTPVPGRNTFISNNQFNGSGTPTGAVDVSVSAGAIVTLEDNFDIDLIINSGGTISVSATSSDHPSYAECGNQNTRLDGEWTNEYIQNSNLDLLYAGSCDDFLIMQTSPLFNARPTVNSPYTLAHDFETKLEGLSEEAILDIMHTLSNTSDISRLYQAVMNANSLSTNSEQWITYYYYKALNDLVQAEQTLHSINPVNADAQELKTLELLTLAVKNGYEVQESDLLTLQQIDENRTRYAARARDLRQLYEGGHDYIFPKPVTPQGFNGQHTITQSLESSYLNVFPNPTSSIVNIEFNVVNSSAENIIRVFDLQGRVIETITTATSATILPLDVKSYAEGVYIITLSNENGVVASQKLIKQ